MEKGYIYIMTNPMFPGVVKIGYATDVEARRKELSKTNVPLDYEVYATYETSGNLEDKILHKMIDTLNPKLRVSKKREFFEMSPQKAYDLLGAIATISGTTDKLKKEKDEEVKQQIVRRPAVNFTECGIPVGADLAFIEDPSITVKVINERKVELDGEITSLTAATKKLKGIDKAIQGPLYFTYNGKNIAEIAEETQWKNCE